METQTRTNDTRAGEERAAIETDSPHSVRITDIRALRRAMQAASNVLHHAGSSTNARLTNQRHDHDELEVLATNGHWLSAFTVPEDRTNRQEPCDLPLDREMIRRLAKLTLRTKEVQIADLRKLPDERFPINFSIDPKNNQWTGCQAPDSIKAETYGQVIRSWKRSTSSHSIRRVVDCKKVIKAIKSMPDEGTGACRLEAGPNGLLAWKTSFEFIPPERKPDAVLCQDHAWGDTPTLFGVNGKYLRGALKALGTDEATITVPRDGHPVQVQADNGQRQFIIMTWALI